MLATIIRHPKERLSKCSLEPLRADPRLRFETADKGRRFDLTGCCVLSVEGRTLTSADRGRELVILDSTWTLLPELEQALDGESIPRCLPEGLVSAYPRRSLHTPHPSGGLASVEALYAAVSVLGCDLSGILDAYYWKQTFLERNADWFSKFSVL